MKECEDLMREQVDRLKKNYRLCKIKACIKAMGLLYTVPSVIDSLSSALHVPFYKPAGIVAAICLSAANVLRTVKKANSKACESP